ncbi:MAG: triose-phosphate isomerase family protein [Chlamydiota bacterium]|nr:triose-phosphate isomerase family protein [Chlamydiota bacterium]
MQYLIGNWKMNGSWESLRAMEAALDGMSYPSERWVGLALPFPYLGGAEGKYHLGAQNVHGETAGAYTGEVSAAMLRDCDVSFCLVGHSERRSQFGEGGVTLRGKIEALLASGIRPLLCLGESQEERASGVVKETLQGQLEEALLGLQGEWRGNILLAYEPRWAIGSGKIPDLGDIEEAHAHCGEWVERQGGEGIPILYGGSVDAGNAAKLCGVRGVSGLLVGGASLKPESFCRIIQSL